MLAGAVARSGRADEGVVGSTKERWWDRRVRDELREESRERLGDEEGEAEREEGMDPESVGVGGGGDSGEYSGVSSKSLSSAQNMPGPAEASSCTSTLRSSELAEGVVAVSLKELRIDERRWRNPVDHRDVSLRLDDEEGRVC